MKKIVIFNQKGGVGKSTSVVNIAGCLSKNLKKRVLVIDLDGQCTSGSYLRTIEGPTEYTLYDYIYNDVPIKDIISPINFEEWDNKKKKYKQTETKISLLASSRYFAQKEFGEEFNDLDLLKRIFSEIDESSYDFCIFDCPGYINKLTESALRISDYILIPAIADIDSLVGFSDLIDTKNRIRMESNNIGLDVLGIVFTMFSGSSLNKQIKQLCIDQMGEDIIFNTYIRRSVAIAEARTMGKPISYYRSSEQVAEDYLTLTKEIIKRIKEREKGK